MKNMRTGKMKYGFKDEDKNINQFREEEEGEEEGDEEQVFEEGEADPEEEERKE